LRKHQSHLKDAPVVSWLEVIIELVVMGEESADVGALVADAPLALVEKAREKASA
jgi:hypothetical protein